MCVCIYIYIYIYVYIYIMGPHRLRSNRLDRLDDGHALAHISIGRKLLLLLRLVLITTARIMTIAQMARTDCEPTASNGPGAYFDSFS